MTTALRPKVPLSWAATLLAKLCDQVDDSPVITTELKEAVRHGCDDLAASIDRRKAVAWVAEGMLKAARDSRAEIDGYIQKLKGIQESLKNEAKEAMELHPDLPWQDSMGRKLSLVNNSQASLKLSFDLKETRTFTGLVHHDTIKMFDIPAKYIATAVVTILDSQAIKADLAAGVTLPWAELERGKHVRGLMPKLKEIEDVAD